MRISRKSRRLPDIVDINGRYFLDRMIGQKINIAGLDLRHRCAEVVINRRSGIVTPCAGCCQGQGVAGSGRNADLLGVDLDNKSAAAGKCGCVGNIQGAAVARRRVGHVLGNGGFSTGIGCNTGHTLDRSVNLRHHLADIVGISTGIVGIVDNGMRKSVDDIQLEPATCHGYPVNGHFRQVLDVSAENIFLVLGSGCPFVYFRYDRRAVLRVIVCKKCRKTVRSAHGLTVVNGKIRTSGLDGIRNRIYPTRFDRAPGDNQRFIKLAVKNTKIVVAENAIAKIKGSAPDGDLNQPDDINMRVVDGGLCKGGYCFHIFR